MANEQEQRSARQAATLIANPYLSKGMLKRTGFEHNFVEPELSIEEQQIELEHYSTENSVCERVETAVLRYKMNRKFHQNTLSVFHAFLNFAGFNERPTSFAGGTSKGEAEGLSKEEKARRRQVNYMSKEVAQSVENADGKWVVDFQGVTKGFFSTCFPGQFLFHDDPEHDRKVTNAACNVIRNFFNYLLCHNVCVEYTDQIQAAMSGFGAIESEYVKLAEVQSVFPGHFSKACSISCGGYYAKAQYQGNWMEGDVPLDSNNGLTAQEAKWIACAGVAAFAAPSQGNDIGLSAELKIVNMEEEVGLEVVAITLPAETSKEAQEFFSKLKGTSVLPMGKLLCKRYPFQHLAPLDLPLGDASQNESFEFILDEGSLQKCYPGLKFIATIKETSASFCFIDYWSECYGSFYTWCWNDKAKDYKEGSNPLQPAKSKNRLAHRDNFTAPLDEDKMLEHATVAQQQDVPAEAMSSNGAQITQRNGQNTCDAKCGRDESNMRTNGRDDIVDANEGKRPSEDGQCRVDVKSETQNSVATDEKAGSNQKASESNKSGGGDPETALEAGFESNAEVASDDGLFSDEESSGVDDD